MRHPLAAITVVCSMIVQLSWSSGFCSVGKVWQTFDLTQCGLIGSQDQFGNSISLQCVRVNNFTLNATVNWDFGDPDYSLFDEGEYTLRCSNASVNGETLREVKF